MTLRQGLLIALCSVTASAAPVITATKDDSVAPGARKNVGDNITYGITITNTGDATATGVVFTDPDPANTSFVSVQSTPVARGDAYTAIGNVQISIAAPGLLANDTDPDGVGPALAVTAVNTAGTQGNVTFNADGSFTFNPTAGFEGNTTFGYTMSDGEGNSDTATVTVTVGGMIWFINSAAAAGGDGRLTTPFNSISNFLPAADDPGDTVFLFSGSYSTGLTLLANQRLIGQGATSSLAAITGLAVPSGSLAFPATGGARPTIAVGSGTGIILGTNNNAQGLNVTNSNGQGITGNAFGTLTLADFDVTVTNGTALSLTTSGTVTVTGSDNDLSATTGVGFNAANVTFGAGGLTFKSIAASGATNGIFLNNTGSGAFTITGDGADNTVGGNFSGGTISAATTGISLTNASNVSLNRIRITGGSEDGLFGTNVTNFTFSNSRVINYGNDISADTDTGLQFVNLIGTVVIKRSVIGPDSAYALSDNPPGAENDGIEIDNTNMALLTMTVTGSQFTNISNDGIDVRGQNSDVTLNVDGSTGDEVNTFTGINGRSVLLEDNNDLANNSNFNIAVNNNTFTNVGIGALWNVHAGSTVVANFNNNTMSGTRDDAIRSLINPGAHVSGFSATTLDATIRSNNMGGGAVYIASRRGGVSTVRLGGAGAGQGNTNIAGAATASGSHPDPVFLETSRGGVLNVDVLQNAMTANANGPEFTFATLSFQTLAGGFGGTAICANVANNSITLQNGAANFQDAIWFDIDAGTTISVEGFGGAGNAAVATFLNGQNTISPSLDPVTRGTWTGTVTSCANAVPLMFAGGGVESSGSPVEPAPASGILEPPPSPEPETSTTPAEAIAPEPLTQTKLDSVVAAARARWKSAKLSTEQLATLRSVQFTVADLPGWYLGEASGNQIRVDSDAGGNGWFYGSTIEDDAQFPNAISPTRRYANPDNAPAGRIDLLTAIMHEMGHSLGLEDSYSESDRNSLMYGFLTKGERRLPAENQAAGATPQTEAHPHFLGAPLNIGDLSPGKSVTITYVVTITGTPTSISNQATISGSNFVSVLTDDPTVAGATNATVTPVELPPTVSNVSKSANEDVATAFSAADFTPGSYTDPNSDPLATVRVTSLPTNGVLKISGSTFTVPQDIAIANIGNLTYTSNLNYNGPDSFGWNGSDGTLFATTGATVNITVNSVNDDPTAGGDTMVRYPTQGVKVPIANLITNDSDIDGGTITFVSVSPISANGGTVTSDGTRIYYTPASGWTAADSFTYTINDGQGGSAIGTVAVNLIVDNAAGMSVTKIETLGNGSMRVNFAGIPGRTYRVQSSETLAPASWVDRLTIQADAQGRFQFTDPPPLPPTRFYRSVQP